MNARWLPFERPLHDLEAHIAELEGFTRSQKLDREAEIQALRRRCEELCRLIYSHLTSWDQVLLARHPARPYTLDYIQLIFTDFLELHGDRRFGDDPALVGGLARLAGNPVVVVGHQKGRDTRERKLRNFGSAHPEGYRKANRLMRLAEKFGHPVVAFVDTPAAESRPEAEARGIALSIAESMALMSRLRTPIVVIIIGEGGSGGAIGLGVGDHVMMLEHAIYSVIPPESCAAILSAFGRDSKRGPEAAEALRLTAAETLRLGVVDEVIPEPLGGAHRDPPGAAMQVGEALRRSLAELASAGVDELLERRYQRLRGIGAVLGG